MVDFQSRDTRRGPTIDDDADDDSESGSDPSADAASSDDDATGTTDAARDVAEWEDPNADTDTAITDHPLADESDAADADTVDADPLADESDAADTDTVDADPLADESDTADADTVDADPLAVESSTATETADERADTAESAPADTEESAPADTEESAPADTEESAPADTAEPVSTDPDTSGTAADSGQSGAAETPPPSKTATPTRSIDVAVVTVSGDRAALEDTVTTAFEADGHAVVRCERPDSGYDSLQQQVDALVGDSAVDVVVTVGGVGLAADELAIEAVHPLLEKALPGFGEAFRDRLADHIGTGIVGVRSTAGLSDGTVVFCLPGDAEAAELAVSEILAIEAPRLVSELES